MKYNYHSNLISSQLHTPRRFRFLKPAKCSIQSYIDRMSLKVKSNKDIFGFLRTGDYLRLEKQYKFNNTKYFVQRDLEWIQYLKSIGGTDNLKPAGIFKPNYRLKQLVRRGIPVAFRSIIWQQTSLCSLHRRLYSEDYFKVLVEKSEHMDPRVAEDIEKDIDRYT